MEKKMEKSRVLSRTCLVATLSLVFSAMTTPVLADPTGKWTTGAPIPVAVEGYGAAQVGNIHYYMGGFSAGDTMLNQRYDKSTDTWLTNGAPIPGPSRGETAAVATGGFVYLVGGRCPLACNLLQRYDPASDTWTTLSPLPVPVDSEHVVAVHDGKIYVARSWTRSMPGSTVMITVDVPVAVVTVSRYTPGSTSNRKDPVTSVVDVPANSCVTALNSCTVVSGDGCPLLVTVPLTGSAHFQMF